MKYIALNNDISTIVDDSDYEWLSQWRWNYSGRYVRRKERANGPAILMHRFILDAPTWYQVDHINRDRLDNRRSNLRLVTPSQNAQNRGKTKGRSSQYIGVCKHKQTGKWQASIKISQKQIHIGLFSEEIDAARAYDVKAMYHYGEYAVLNFPLERNITTWK